MYGGYHPDFDLGSRKPFLARLRRFASKVEQLIVRAAKMAGRAVSVVVGGAILFCLMLNGCRQQQNTVVGSEKIIYVTKDTTIYKDSTVYVPVEIYRDYSRLTDTLVMSTSLAKAKAWNDTVAWTINGLIENKQAVQYQYVEIEKWHTKDSIVEREKPIYITETVEKVKRPWWAWICLTWTIVTLCSIAFVVYKKIKGLV